MKTKKNSKNTLQKEIQEVEQWVIEKRKFLKKLGITIALIIILIIISNLYLKAKGIGI